MHEQEACKQSHMFLQVDAGLLVKSQASYHLERAWKRSTTVK